MALLTELGNGKFNRFRLVGKVKLSDNGFSGPKAYEGSNWYGVNDSFGVEVEDGNVVYPRISGGYDLKDKVLKKFDTDYKQIKVPIADRHKEAWVKKIAPNHLVRASIIKSGDHVERKEFLSEIDYSEYLKENLADGTEVVVTGDVSYSLGKDGENVYRNYDVKNIYLNATVTDEDGNTSLKNKREGYIVQTYLLDDSSLDPNYKKELKDNGRTVVSVQVPQYVGKIFHNGQKVPWRKISALQQALVYQVDLTDKDKLEKQLKWPERLFKVKRDTVREIHLFAKINEGYETQSASDMVITPAMQMLIDDEVFTKEELLKQKQATIRGSRASELIYIKPQIEFDKETGDPIPYSDDKYSANVLISPMFDDEDGEEASDLFEEDADDSVTKIDDEDFESIFGL